MTRKNTWLPGQPGFGNPSARDEPGEQRNRRDLPRWNGPAQTPLIDLINGAVYVVIAFGLGYWALTFAGHLNLIASLIVAGGILVMIGVAVWRFQHAIRRIIWRRKHIALTGGRYLRAWERTPTSY